MGKVTFGKMLRFGNTGAGDSSEADILLDGVVIGTISSILADVSTGMHRTWKVVGYEVTLWEKKDGERTFDVGADGARSTLALAKAWVRENVSK